MQWLVDIDQAVEDGVIDAGAGEALKARGREGMIGYAIGLGLCAGVAMVIGGAAFLLKDERALLALGAALAGLGFWALLRGGERWRIPANAAAIIGAALALGAAGYLANKQLASPFLIGCLLGLPAAAAGYWLNQPAAPPKTAPETSPEALRFFGGWLLLLGAACHVIGLLSVESDGRYAWIAMHYVAAVTLCCGVLLNVRFVTAAAIIPLAAALSSRTFYFHASYGVAIYEAALTILQMSVVALLALYISTRSTERFARHARITGQMAVIWTNMAFWIGSLWGDEVGKFLWGPRRQAYESFEAWREANDAFLASALVIPDEAFAGLWALGLLCLGAWAAYAARRAVLNICVVFGAIHFYTQYFERLEATPGAFVVAGLIAILAAWGLRSINQRLPQAVQSSAG